MAVEKGVVFSNPHGFISSPNISANSEVPCQECLFRRQRIKKEKKYQKKGH